jgi:UMF1 family MFS transporter
VFAIQVLEMEAAELGQVILMIQFIALPSAFVVGWIGDRYGQKRTLVVCLVVWTLLSISAWFITTKAHFWVMATIAALVMGGTQTVSRAMMGLMTPKNHTAEFFGFFGLSGRMTSMLGPVFFSTILASTGSPHLAITSLVIFFVLGLAILLPVDVNRGRQQAHHDSKR